MHELDVLDRFLPEFSAITALAQHDLYHYFSADEHTLLAVENVAKLAQAEDDPFEMKKTLLELPDKRPLFLGLLFHDIGKSVPGPHTSTGVELARKIFSRWKIHGELEAQVLFLIANHLKMEQFAFRRNSEDPSTLQQFAKIVGNVTNLRLLYLLTYGDLSALNPTLWSEWKAIQLWELFRKTRRYLEGKCVSVSLSESELRKLAAEIASEAKNGPRETLILEHLKQMGEEYLKFFENREILRHIELIQKLDTQPAAIDFQDLRTHWGVTVVTRDRPSLLGNMCGVLAANDLSIFSAQIFTRTDGVAIDTFRVLPFSSYTHFSEINAKDILEDFTRVLSEKGALQTLLVQHKRRWKRRRLKQSGRPAEVVFDNTLSREFTIIDVFTDDALGLLYQIATALAKSGVSIFSARISTRVDQVSDSFYVLDNEGKKIVEPDRQENIRQNILRSIRRRL
jgi:[protein-PII] uridylyltransferase